VHATDFRKAQSNVSDFVSKLTIECDVCSKQFLQPQYLAHRKAHNPQLLEDELEEKKPVDYSRLQINVNSTKDEVQEMVLDEKRKIKNVDQL